MHLHDDLTAEMIVEIHSSPYEDTLRKALTTAIDLLHLGRMYSNTKYHCFCFPKLKTKRDQTIKENNWQCVVKLEITEKDFAFQTPVVQIDGSEAKHNSGFQWL